MYRQQGNSCSMVKISKPSGRILWGAAQIVLLHLGLNNAGSAQTAPAPVAPSGASPSASGEKPQRTTASYDDWILQCYKRVGPPPEKTCEIAQVVQMQLQGKNVPFSLVVIPRPINPKSTKMIVQLPVNVSLQGNVILQTDKADPGIAVPFARCVASGCVAEFDLKEDAVKKLRNAAGAGSITFKSSNEQDVAVPLSLKGLAPALDALAKE
jgi:invasion protein IalB